MSRKETDAAHNHISDSSVVPREAVRPTGLPHVAPLWASDLEPMPEPETVEEFFGITSTTAKSGAPVKPPLSSGSELSGDSADTSDRASIGRDRLAHLGPLIIDDYDLAPDIIRMYTNLRED